MLVPSRLSRLLLLLLLLALSARSVCGQTVEVSVEGGGMIARWNRTGGWEGVEHFTVTITNPTNWSCTEHTTCRSDPCRFRSQFSEECGSLEACSHNEVTVSGGSNTSDPVPFQTAPEPVTDLVVYVSSGVLNIFWTNPPIQSSSCHTDTLVEVYVRDAEYSIFYSAYHPVTEENMVLNLTCVFLSGQVHVLTRGGDGHSKREIDRYQYSSGPIPATHQSCRPEGCFGIDFTWDYNPVCPNVTHFCVKVDDREDACTEDTATTSLLVTGLEVDRTYALDLVAYVKDKLVWDSLFRMCSTQDTAVVNLTADVTPTSINASWGAPACLPPEDLLYEVSIYKSSCYLDPQEITNETSYMLTGLEDFERYCVSVAPKGKDVARRMVFTQPRRVAWLRLGMAGEDSVLVEWEKINYAGHREMYVLTYQTVTIYTSLPKYTIKGYSSTEELGGVCVAVYQEPDESTNVTGPARCSDDPGQKPKDEDNVLLIVLLSVGIPIVIIVFGGIALALWRLKKKKEVLPSAHYSNQPDRDVVLSEQQPSQTSTNL